MINLIVKKISVLFALAFLFVLAPSLSGNNDAMAACSAGTDSAKCAAATSATAGNTCSWDGTTCNDIPGGTGRTNLADNNAFVDTLCNVFSIATGNGGKAFAAFAIISLGIGFFTGKVSWGLMIGVAAGIAAMFGAPTIVAAIGGGTAYDCS